MKSPGVINLVNKVGNIGGHVLEGFVVHQIDGLDLQCGSVAELVGIEGGVVSGVFNLESSDVGASDRRPRHEENYHEV